jgi:hypothetical protein
MKLEVVKQLWPTGCEYHPPFLEHTPHLYESWTNLSTLEKRQVEPFSQKGDMLLSNKKFYFMYS